MAVKVIKAKKAAEARTAEVRKTRVAAYCRVSTDSEEQEGSYEAQKRHYQTFISGRGDWELAGIFADEGITGTQAKKRPEFLRMIQACEDGEVDMVVTKSISRFARNTLDCLKYIRLLKDKGIPILFEKENINTMDAKGEVLITIMASIAQQESQSISQNVRIGIQYRMQQGHGRLNTSVFLGLTRGKEPGDLVIVPEEAEVVRRIFREFLDGYSPAMICKRLEAGGFLTGAGRENWHPSTVCRMLENEKYCGDVLLQKYYTTDFLTHKVTKNTGQFPQYFVEDHHEPIVPKEVFRQVQGELMRRSATKGDPLKLRLGLTMPLTGRLVCGKCGRKLKRCISPNGMADWRCQDRKAVHAKKLHYKERRSICGCRFVPEEDVKAAIVKALNRLLERRDELIRTQAAIREGELKRIDALAEQSRDTEIRLEDRRARVMAESGGERTEETEFLDGQIATLQERRNELILERANHANREVHVRLLLELVDIMMERRERLFRRTEPEIPCGEDFTPSCSDYEEFFRRTRYNPPEGVIDEAGHVTRFEESLVIRYLDTVLIHDDCYEVRFKAGISIRV